MKFLFIIPTLFSLYLCAQKKVYNNKFINPKTVTIHNHVDTQIVYNPSPRTAKLYLLNAVGGHMFIRSQGISKYYYTIIIGNPDSAIVYDPKFDIEFVPGYDTAYFIDDSKLFKDINNKGARDQRVTINKDHKHILYSASYFGAGYKKTLQVFCSPDAAITYDGLGSLY